MPELAAQPRQSQHGTWVEIRRDRLQSNLDALERLARPGTDVLAVIKANAYGHGLAGVARTLASRVSCFGVSSIHEAMDVMETLPRSRVFVFSGLPYHEIPLAVSQGFILTVSNLHEAQEISEAAVSLSMTATIHVKVDTGMGRFGIPFADALNHIEKISELKNLRLEGLYTHFPSAELEDAFAARQVRDFSLLVKALETRGITFRYRHGANSAGCLTLQDPVFNMIRPGIMLYGLYPSERLRERVDLQEVLSLRTRIILLKRIGPGDSVGYGRDFVAERPSTIALCPIGYSHGYPFAASGKASVLYKGRRYPLAGRVSMDYLAVNLSDTHARPGDMITLIGSEDSERISAADLASWSGTIPYEIVTRLSAALPRHFI